MRTPHSIRSRLTVYLALFAALVVIMAGTVVLALSAVQRDTESVNRKWLAGTRVLSELEARVAEFRLAETYRALAGDGQAAAEAEAAASQHREAIDALVPTYVQTVGAGRPEADVSAFETAWRDYLVVHDAWLRADVYGRTRNLARSNSSLHWRYKVVDQAVDVLKQRNTAAADAQTASSVRIAHEATLALSGAAVVAVLLVGLLWRRIDRTITKPLAGITAALTTLAQGRHDTVVPETDRRDEIGAMASAFEVFRANAAELESAHAATRSAQEKADALARHDALTGLPNRRVFAAELEGALGGLGARRACFSVMLIDLDKFKPVNDVRGHSVGDRVLCEVARRLGAVVERNGVVARLGGDEFALISPPAGDLRAAKAAAIAVAGRVLQALRAPFDVADGQVEIGSSIGIACCPIDGTGAEDILRAADLAMYRAKQDGRDTFRFFEQSMDDDLRVQVALDEGLRRALRTGGIKPFYQPLVDIKQGRVIGFELLARWHDPEHGMVSPDVFIPMAERLNLIGDLTYAVLREGCRDAASWPPDTKLAINISPLQLKDAALPPRILAILSEEGFPPSRLEVEITESALVGDIEVAREIITALQAVGITVSLDDFGTGYSSLYHLRNLKFDRLKIDRSFVQSLHSNAESEKIVDAVLSLARSLGMPVIAEGIEEESARAHLEERGCDFGQGYLFSRALDAPAAARLVGRDAPRLSA